MTFQVVQTPAQGSCFILDECYSHTHLTVTCCIYIYIYTTSMYVELSTQLYRVYIDRALFDPVGVLNNNGCRFHVVGKWAGILQQ